MVIEAIIISVVSLLGVATISKVGLVASVNLFNLGKRKYEKRKLKKLLKKSLKNYDFVDFQNIIYQIKTYDNAYNKSLFIKMKKKYFFYDKTVNNIDDFNNRFLDDNNIINIIRNEIELSLSRRDSF